MTGNEPIQRHQHRPRICPIGLDPLVLAVPIARADHIIGHSERRQLPMQRVAEWPGFVTGDDPPSGGLLLRHPFQQADGAETARGLEHRVEHRCHHDAIGMHIQGQFQQRHLRLPNGSRRSTNKVVSVHRADSVGRNGGGCLPSCFLPTF